MNHPYRKLPRGSVHYQMKYLFICLGAAIVTTASGGGSDIRLFSAEQLKEISDSQAREMKQNGTHAAGIVLGEWATHSAALSQRIGDGMAELHRDLADFFIVREGEAVLVTGGDMIKPFRKSDGEIRAAAIDGGERRILRRGDVAYIPAGVPHQLLVKESFLYFVIKVHRRDSGPERER